MNTILYNVNPKWLFHLLFILISMINSPHMSSEQVNINHLEAPKVIENKLQTKVDINLLLSRVRQEQKKENKGNLILFAIVVSVIFSAGIILSL